MEMVEDRHEQMRQVAQARRAVENAQEEKRLAEEQKCKAEAKMKTEKEKRERAEKERHIADEATSKATALREAAETAAAAANTMAREAQAALEIAESRLRKGNRNIFLPTDEEFEATKRRLKYTPGLLHFAIAGVSGSGKSSLINAIRGLKNQDKAAAPTGVVETTNEITHYPDPDPSNPFVWYDVPGAGTLKIPGWKYFNDQGLYIFDCILILFDSRFTDTDVSILENSINFGIPTYIVRSKSNQNIRNVMMDMEDDSSDEDQIEAPARLKRAREHYITMTRQTVQQNLDDAGLPRQKVYVISKESLAKIAKVLRSKETKLEMPRDSYTIDELELMNDLLSEAHNRRRVHTSP